MAAYPPRLVALSVLPYLSTHRFGLTTPLFYDMNISFSVRHILTFNWKAGMECFI